MIRRPPRSTLDRSSAASDVYKRQLLQRAGRQHLRRRHRRRRHPVLPGLLRPRRHQEPVSYTHLRAHETVLDLVCRLLLEKKKTQIEKIHVCRSTTYLTVNYDTQLAH